MKNIRIKLFAIIALALLAGCSKVGNEDRNETKDGGYFVLNSGNINVNNSNISVFNVNNKELTLNAFYQANGKYLGDLGQDILVAGDEIYISVSNSRRIFVTDS